MLAAPLGSKHSEGVISVVPETDEIVAVCLEGEFDMANARTVGEEIDRTLQSGKDLILDLSEATFIDSSLTDVLIRAVTAGVKKSKRSSFSWARPQSSSVSSRSPKSSNCCPALTVGRRPCGSFSRNEHKQMCRRRSRRLAEADLAWGYVQRRVWRY